MKTWYPAIVALLIGAFPCTLLADTVKLKDGTILEGTVVEDVPGAATITLEYNLTPGIKEDKVIARADIASIDKDEPDEVAYAEIQKLVPTPDLLTSPDYDALLSGKPAAFMEQFKESKLREKVQVVVDQLLSEKAKVDAGGVKIGGSWITGEEADKDRYNHDAKVLLARMNRDLLARDFPGAMSSFESIEKDHGHSLAFLDAHGVATGALPKYAASIAQLTRENAALTEQREANLRSLDDSERRRAEAAFGVQMGAFKARRSEAKKAKRTWLPVSKWDLESLEETAATIEKETARLAKLDLEELRPAVELYTKAAASLNVGRLERALVELDEARTAGGNGAPFDQLRERIETAKEAADEAARAAAAAAAAESDPDGPDGPDGPDEPGSGDPSNGGGETGPGEEPAGSESTGTASDEGGDGDEEADSAEKKKGLGFQTLLIILAGVLLCVTVVAKLFFGDAEEGQEEE